MNISYVDKHLEKECTDEKTMRKKHGNIAKRLKLRINALEEATCIRDLRVIDGLGGWHGLNADRKGSIAGKLSANYRLLVRPVGFFQSSDEFLKCCDIEVQGIEDYHGK